MIVSAFIMPFILSLNAMFTFNNNLIETILISIPWSLLFAISCHYSVGIIFWQITYFYLICFYLDLKLKNLNKTIKNLSLKINYKRILSQIDLLYREISVYNKQYWNQFLLLFCLTYATVICTLVYGAIFGSMNFILRFIISFAAITHSSIFAIVILSASKVSSQTSRTHKLLTDYYIKRDKLKSNNSILKLKASLFKK
jgi:hypothetical protein